MAEFKEMKVGYCPEVKKGEVFLGNVKIPYEDKEVQQIPSIRLGEQGYDIYAEELPSDLYRPLIVAEGKDYDTYNRIMQRRLDAIGRNKNYRR